MVVVGGGWWWLSFLRPTPINKNESESGENTGGNEFPTTSIGWVLVFGSPGADMLESRLTWPTLPRSARTNAVYYGFAIEWQPYCH